MAVTKRQKQVLDFVARFIEDNGYSPSYEEIARGLNLASLATVHKHISTLETKQYLKRGFNQSRSLDLGPKYIQEQRKHRQDTSLEVPLEQRETVRFGDFLGNPDVFALEVLGDSMIEDHICSGDLVLVEKANQAKDGDIVVALIEGAQTTLKRFYREPGDRVRLQPANSSLQPIYVAGKDLAIQGRLLAVLRKYR
jgi:repressor LexA